MNEIKIIDLDGYENILDEVVLITVHNSLGMRFEFKLEDIKSIELVVSPLPVTPSL